MNRQLPEALERAAAAVGGKAALARLLDMKAPSFYDWKQIPAARVIPIYRATQGKVTPHEMRGDLYPDPKMRPRL